MFTTHAYCAIAQLNGIIIPFFILLTWKVWSCRHIWLQNLVLLSSKMRYCWRWKCKRCSMITFDGLDTVLNRWEIHTSQPPLSRSHQNADGKPPHFQFLHLTHLSSSLVGFCVLSAHLLLFASFVRHCLSYGFHSHWPCLSSPTFSFQLPWSQLLK